MGGNALSTKSHRLPAPLYHQVARDVVTALKRVYPGRVKEIPAYNQKADFGDLDVLIESSPEYDPFKLAEALHGREVVRNGDCTSVGVTIDYFYFQVDLVKVPPESYDFAFCYFSYNDVGNLLGRIAHKAGFKLGHLGLLYPMRDHEEGTHLLGEPVVTRNFYEALSLMGYNPEPYRHRIESGLGFNDLEEIFRYVVSSPFVNPDIYILDNRNHAARMRDRKRPTYQKFLKWLQEQPEWLVPKFPWGASGTKERALQKEGFLNRAFALNPEFKTDHYEIQMDYLYRQEVKAKFNGSFVSQWTGLEGKKLGGFMAWMKRAMGEGTLYAFVWKSSELQVEELVRSLFDKYKESPDV